MMNVIICEDEINSQKALKFILENHCNDINVVGVCDSVSLTVEAINSLNPDLVFLDVEINEGNGFDVLHHFEKPSFKVVFVTGYDHYAIKAIKYSAIDYLLKPLNIPEVQKAVTRAQELSNDSNTQRIEFLNSNFKSNVSSPEQFLLSGHKSSKIIKFDEILFAKSNGPYIHFYLENGEKHVAIKPLKYFESILPKALFFRAHKSYLVNIKKVINIGSGRGGVMQMKEGHEIPISYRRKSLFLKKIRDADIQIM